MGGNARFAGVAALLFALPALGQENLVRNPSFEQGGPAAWNANRLLFSHDLSTARSGKASLRWKNSVAGRYVLTTQIVRARPGKDYTFGVWVRTRGLKGRNAGALIAMEYWSADPPGPGNFLGGQYPIAIREAREWTRLWDTGRVPAEAQYVRIVVAVKKGSTGTVWFDDVECRRLLDPPLRTVLAAPHYRGTIPATDRGEVRVRVTLNPAQHHFRLGEVVVSAELVGETGRVHGSDVRQRPGAASLELSIETGALPPGRYKLKVVLARIRGGKPLARDQHAVQVVASRPARRVSFDRHRRLLLGHKPFFPLGMYWMRIGDRKDLRLFADSRFNCLMPYVAPDKAEMDLAQDHGLKVIYCLIQQFARVKDEWPLELADEEPAVRAKVRRFRDHPALLAWYLTDELPVAFIPRLELHQRWVAEEDPDHPTWIGLMQPERVYDYLDCFDAIGTDPYPIPGRPLSLVARHSRETLAQVLGLRPVWMVPQVFNRAAYKKNGKGNRPPTLREMRCMAWQALCEGATGLIFYSFFDLKRDPAAPFETRWRDCKKLAAGIDSMIEVLLSVEPVPAIKVRAGPWLHWMARSHEGKLFLMAVNDGDGEGRVTFRLPGTIRAVKVRGENRIIRPYGAAFSDRFDKLDVHIYELTTSG